MTDRSQYVEWVELAKPFVSINAINGYRFVPPILRYRVHRIPPPWFLLFMWLCAGLLPTRIGKQHTNVAV
jgi:hypothetical protein